MTRMLCCFALLVPALTASSAQTRPVPLDPVHWSAESHLPSSVVPGTRFTVTLHATIDEEWHLYALPEKDTFPLATEIALAKTPSADLLQVKEEKPRHSMDPESHVVTGWFAQSATFTLRLAATSETPRDLQVLVHYQACNDRMCLPPRNVTVPVQFRTGR